MDYDTYFKQIFASVPQSKVSKMKLVGLAEGFDRHSSWFLGFGDYLPSVQRPPYDENTPQWLIPELSYHISPDSRGPP